MSLADVSDADMRIAETNASLSSCTYRACVSPTIVPDAASTVLIDAAMEATIDATADAVSVVVPVMAFAAVNTYDGSTVRNACAAGLIETTIPLLTAVAYAAVAVAESATFMDTPADVAKADATASNVVPFMTPVYDGVIPAVELCVIAATSVASTVVAIVVAAESDADTLYDDPPPSDADSVATTDCVIVVTIFKNVEVENPEVPESVSVGDMIWESDVANAETTAIVIAVAMAVVPLVTNPDDPLIVIAS